MKTERMTLWRRWSYASKPGSWPKLLVPTLLGQALGWVASGAWSWGALAFGLAFMLLDGLFIVWLNDWGDRHVDALKRQMFPLGCSPKTIPDGILPAESLLWGGVGAGLLALGVAGLAQLWLGHGALVPGAALCLGLFVAYSLPPLRLNYRGGGELLEMLGVGVALPWWQACLQSGALWHESYLLLGGYALLSLASALASGLSDEDSDKAGGKITYATRHGNWRTRVAVEVALWFGPLAWWLAAALGALPVWMALLASAPVLWFGHQARQSSHLAVRQAFTAQKRYKQQLHRAIWGGGLELAALLALYGAWEWI